MNNIMSLKSKKSREYDNILALFIVVGAHVLADPFSYFFNLALHFGMFPQCLKTAKVVHVFKSGKNT